VDDHAAFRAVLRDLIPAARGFDLVGEACSGEDALHAVDRASPELVLMDVMMPGMGGISAARTILSTHPGVIVVLISVEEPSLYPGASQLGSHVSYARKQDLCPSELTRLWETHL
jgi:DNA-binding NarL/FixJ family response regulator